MAQDRKTKQSKRNIFLLLIASFIWGIAFVAQSEGGDIVGSYSFNCIRSFIGALVLLPVIRLFSDNQKTSRTQEQTLWIGGIFCGIALGVASNLQQLGIYYGHSTGKAGFVTACYVVLVPILGIFLKKHCPFNVWIAAVFTLVGLYFLCLGNSLSLDVSDMLLLLCAVSFSVQILLVDHYSPLVPGVKLACIEFLVAGIVSLFPMVFFEIIPTGFSKWAASFGSIAPWVSILYAGALSSGVAYTLQIIGQRNVNPTAASILMSLESVFAVLGAWVIQGQTLSPRQLLGCSIIFASVILSQISFQRIHAFFSRFGQV